MSGETDEITRLHHVIEDVLWSCEQGYLYGAIATLRKELLPKPQSFVQMMRQRREPQ
jgi:hypothetical protein